MVCYFFVFAVNLEHAATIMSLVASKLYNYVFALQSFTLFEFCEVQVKSLSSRRAFLKLKIFVGSCPLKFLLEGKKKKYSTMIEK